MLQRLKAVLNGCLLFLGGAYFAFFFLWDVEKPASEAARELLPIIMVAFVVMLLARNVVDWRTRKEDGPAPTISPAASGALVVLATGFAAALSLGWNGDTLRDFALPALIAAITLVAAALVYVFARRHEKEIGEARFPTSNASGQEKR